MRLHGVGLLWFWVSAVNAQALLEATDISADEVQQFVQQLPREVGKRAQKAVLTAA